MQPGRILFDLLFASVLVGLAGMLSSLLLQLYGPSGQELAWRVIASYARVLVYAFAAYLWLRVTGNTLKSVFAADARRIGPVWQVLGVVAGGGVIIGAHLLWMSLYPVSEAAGTDRGAILEGLSSMPVIFGLQVLDYTVITPLCEEVFFRRMWLLGMLSMMVAKTTPRAHLWCWTVFSVAFTALAFAAVHGEPSRLPPLIVAGVVLGLQTLWVRHIGLSIATHIIVNTIATLALLT